MDDYSVSESNMDMSSMMASGVQVDIYGKDTTKLEKISEDVMKMLEKTDKYEDITNGQEEGKKELVVSVNKDKAMRYGLTVARSSKSCPVNYPRIKKRQRSRWMIRITRSNLSMIVMN